jgi:two-component system, chemotaxis family, chemotaxis protein CheY
MKHFDLSDLTFLIAEDNRFKISLLRQQLRAFEAGEIIECLDGAEAFDALCAKKIDFVITDSSMSPVDGLTLVRQIRTNKLSPNPEIPVIILVENPDLARLTSARDVGATEVLSKPVSATLLSKRIQYALKNSREFVKADEFVGPDRRRRKVSDHKKEERRQL